MLDYGTMGGRQSSLGEDGASSLPILGGCRGGDGERTVMAVSGMMRSCLVAIFVVTTVDDARRCPVPLTGNPTFGQKFTEGPSV